MENDNIGEAAWEEPVQPHNWQYMGQLDSRWEGTDEYHAFDMNNNRANLQMEGSAFYKPEKQVESCINIFDMDAGIDMPFPQSA